MRNLSENLTSATRALRENWLRSSLTMLGMIIGVGSVVLLIGIAIGVKTDVFKQVDSLGTNVVFIVPGKLDRSGQPNAMSTLGISTLTYNDVDSLKRVPGVKQVVPLMFVFGSVERKKQAYSALVFASTDGIFDIRPHPLEKGRFFRRDELNQNICVLSDAPKQEIFGNEDAIGKTIDVQGKPFRVVGVLQKEEDSLFGQFSFVNVIYIPLPAARKVIQGGQLNRILLQTDLSKNPKPVLAAVNKQLLGNHGKEDYGVVTPGQLLSAIFRLLDIVQSLVIGIGAISLIVAGIGIMNIMLVTVTERTREIGIRKTVGARNQDIFVQFLTEAVVLAFIGGLIGVLLAWVLCLLVGHFTALKPLITGWAILLACGVCFAVGVIFGVTPAMRASRQDPIDALRYE